MKRSPLLRKTPIRRISAKRRKEQAELRKIIPALFERCGGQCEAVRCVARAEDPHHIKPRSQGVDNSPENIIMLCRFHHRFIHDHPSWARQHGLLK